MKWDVFISHAYEDKENFVRPLAAALQNRGLKVWYDEFSLKLGDSLRESIDVGLKGAQFGVVVLSPSFFQKRWSQFELGALVAREAGGEKVILPVWHNLGIKDVRLRSPLLADRLAVSSAEGVERVAEVIASVVSGNTELEKNLPLTSDDSPLVSIELRREKRMQGKQCVFDVYLDGAIIGTLANGDSIVLKSVPGMHELMVAYKIWAGRGSSPMGPVGSGWSKGRSPVHRREFRRGEWIFECGYAKDTRPWSEKLIGALSTEGDESPLFIRLQSFAPTVGGVP